MVAAIEAAMLDAHRAGLSVIPLGPGKRPTVRWGEYQDTQPDELDVARWSKSAEGFAMICGGSQRIQVLDFEAEFVAVYWRQFVLGLDDDSLTAFTNWLEGYDVITPTGGKHVAVHLIGDDPQPGNVKLAGDGDGHVLAETRGHGGYVAAAPSNGTTHPSGGQWVQNQGGFDQIAWATAEEWSAICAAISKFDAVAAASETPPEALPPTALPGGVSLSRIEHSGSWIDGVKLPSAEEILERAGWTYSHTDRDGINYWCRPDKPPQEGHSATVWPNGRVKMFTNSTVIPQSPQHGNYDVVDVIGYLTIPGFNHQRTDDRVQVFRRYREITAQPLIPVDIRVPTSVCLPDEFWNERPWLTAIRDDALDRLISPEALFGAVLSTYSTTIPPQIKVPRMVGAASPLGMYVALVGGTGTGKSTAMKASRELLGLRSNDDFLYGRGLRSGEGLVTLAMLPPGKVPRGAEPPPPAFRSGVQISFDEIKALQSQADRLGGTTVSYLISGWSGLSELGGAKAAGVESIPEDTTQFSAVFGVQPGVAAALFTGEALTQGFPGRLLYFNLNSDAVQAQPDERPDRPLIGVIGLPRWLRSEGREIGEMEVPSFVETAVRRWRKARMAEANPDPVRAHEMLLKARTACVLALMDSSAQMLDDHWQWSALIDEASVSVRDALYARVHDDSQQRARAAGVFDAIRKNATHDYWVEERAIALARAVHLSPHTARQVKDRFKNDVRHLAPDVVAYAIEHGWVQYAVGERKKLLIAGESRPA